MAFHWTLTFYVLLITFRFSFLFNVYYFTPDCVVWFLSGCLPAEALLHLRQISLFGMICGLQQGKNILADHARHIFATAKTSSKSWFVQLQNVFLQYSLPHPIFFLDNPPSKFSFKSKVKAVVIDHCLQISHRLIKLNIMGD